MAGKGKSSASSSTSPARTRQHSPSKNNKNGSKSNKRSKANKTKKDKDSNVETEDSNKTKESNDADATSNVNEATTESGSVEEEATSALTESVPVVEIEKKKTNTEALSRTVSAGEVDSVANPMSSEDDDTHSEDEMIISEADFEEEMDAPQMLKQMQKMAKCLNNLNRKGAKKTGGRPAGKKKMKDVMSLLKKSTKIRHNVKGLADNNFLLHRKSRLYTVAKKNNPMVVNVDAFLKKVI